MKKIISLVLLAIILTSALASCADPTVIDPVTVLPSSDDTDTPNDTNTPAASSPSPLSFPEGPVSYHSVTKGYQYFDGKIISPVAYLMYFEPGGTYRILCEAPDCAHGLNDCAARFTSILTLVENDIIYLCILDREATKQAGKNQFSLVRYDYKTGDKTTLCTLSDAVMDMMVYGDNVYFDIANRDTGYPMTCYVNKYTGSEVKQFLADQNVRLKDIVDGYYVYHKYDGVQGLSGSYFIAPVDNPEAETPLDPEKALSVRSYRNILFCIGTDNTVYRYDFKAATLTDVGTLEYFSHKTNSISFDEYGRLYYTLAGYVSANNGTQPQPEAPLSVMCLDTTTGTLEPITIPLDGFSAVSIISIQQGVLYIDGSRPTDGPDKENLVIGFDLASGKITVYDSYIGTGRSFNVQ